MGTRITTRPGSRILALVVALGAGFALGMVVAPTDALERAQQQTMRNEAIIDALGGDYGLDRTELAEHELFALAPVYLTSEITGRDCQAVAADLMATRDYVPSMAPCLGEEDSPAVAVILGN